MIVLQNITYIYSNRELLFDNINLTVNTKEKIALIGNNGSGKSTLLRIIAGQLPVADTVSVSSKPYFVPQLFGQFDSLIVAQVLRIDAKLNALYEILSGNVSESNLSLLNND